MDNQKLESIGYALGWVENCLEKNLEEAQPADKKYAKELYDSYMIISDGFSKLHQENLQLKQQLQKIMSAISG